jgi:hypothetical protein
MTTPIGNFLKTENFFGPKLKVFVHLEDSDIKKLSFVMSKSKTEMEKNYEEFRAMRLMGKKVETEKFNPNHLSLYKFIPEINLFVDGIPKPIKLSDKEKKYILDHQKKSIPTNQNDYFNLRFGIEIGEKIEKESMTAIFVRSNFLMTEMIEALIETYSDPNYVFSMLPMKAIAAVIDSDDHYIRILKLYQMFGIKIISELLEYFDIHYFFGKLMISTLCYSTYVNHQIELADEDPNYSDLSYFEEILQDGQELYQFFEALFDHYPEMSDLKIEHKTESEKIILEADIIFDSIKNSLSDGKHFIEMFIQ